MFTIQEIRTSEKMYEKNMEVMNGKDKETTDLPQ